MAYADFDYEKLPDAIKSNLTPDQWDRERHDLIGEGDLIPETTQYIDVKNGVPRTYPRGQTASGLLPRASRLRGGH